MRRQIIITGAAGGIGSALVAAFVAHGDQVIAVDQRPGVDSTDVSWVRANLGQIGSDAGAAAALIGDIRRASGGRCDVLINNAATQILGDFLKLGDDDWAETMAVNLIAPVVLTRSLLPLIATNAGVVINISSIHAHQTKPGFTAYATSKAALSALTRALAVELGAQVRFVTIEPAAIATPMLRAGFEGDPAGFAQLESMHPAGRIGLPEEVARLAVVVSSPGMDFVNGTAIGIDGGIAGRLYDPA